jgi:predicted DNA binding CopG/RHH family protein
MVRKTTSLKIDEEVWKAVKIKCIEDGLEISEYLERLIKKDLKGKKK